MTYQPSKHSFCIKEKKAGSFCRSMKKLHDFRNIPWCWKLDGFVLFLEQSRRAVKTLLPGKAHRHPRKLRLERRNAEACESCPAALLSKCQLVMCHLFKAANLTSTEQNAPLPCSNRSLYPQESTSLAEKTDHQGQVFRLHTLQIHTTLLAIFFSFFFKCVSKLFDQCQPAGHKPLHSWLVGVYRIVHVTSLLNVESLYILISFICIVINLAVISYHPLRLHYLSK